MSHCPPASVLPDTDQSSACSCDLGTEPGPAGPILVLRVAGEVDMVSLPLLQQALDEALERHPGDLVVDLAAVSFCCVRGLALLATTTAATAQAADTSYAVSGLSSFYDRLAMLLWPEDTCVRYRSVAAAVSSIRTDRTYRPV